MELIETSIFTRQIDVLLSEEEYRGLQFRIAANPVSVLSSKAAVGYGRFALPLDREGKAEAPV